MSIPELVLTKENGVATLTINRPERMNAMTTPMYHEMQRIVEDIREDDNTKVLILTGKDPAFCAGSDVRQRLSARIEGEVIEKSRKEMLEPVGLVASMFASLVKPTIAAVNGVATGAGLSFALLCDIRVASDKARFGAAWARVGLIPDLGATYTLPRLIGPDKAFEIFLTGDLIDASEAERVGLVTRVVPHDELMGHCHQFAQRIADGPSVAMELIKRAVYRGLHNDLDKQLDFETYAQNVCRQTEDHKEGVAAFMEKRKPAFKGF